MGKRLATHVILSTAAQHMLKEDVTHRNRIEACGVLLGKNDEYGNWHVREVYPLENVSSSPVYFEFSPEELLTVELTYGNEVIGVYHSHPTGFAKASSTDRENMQRVNAEQQIPWVWLIIRGPFDETFEQYTQIPRDSIIGYHHLAQDNTLYMVEVELETIETIFSDRP